MINKEYLTCKACGKVLPITKEDLMFLYMRSSLLCPMCQSIIIEVKDVYHEANTNTRRQSRESKTV